jgi:cytochrome c
MRQADRQPWHRKNRKREKNLMRQPHFAFMAAVAFLAAVLVETATSAPARAAGDPTKGKQIFAKCQACHSIEAGVNKIGPSLHGVVGRKAGSLPDYHYTDAMKNSGLTWDEATLDKYLAAPRKLVPGTRMIFPGLPKEKDRQDVIAYLKQAGG